MDSGSVSLRRPLHTSRPHVVIVGGGFGGLYTARGLARTPVDVTVVDQHNYHLFRPMLYQVATGLLSEEEFAALQSLLVSRTLNLTDELLHSAAREIEAVMFERVIDRLRAALPEIVAAALREQLSPGD